MTEAEARSYGWKERSAAFADWWNRVNRECVRISGLDLDDLPDYDFATDFNAGIDPRITAEDVLSGAEYPDVFNI